MTDPNFIILYVADPAISAQFYADLLVKQPLEASPTFAMFALDAGTMLGLWSTSTVTPTVMAKAGGCELAFAVDSKESVDAMYADWCHRRLVMAQDPCRMDFGYTFVALDPDGHRLRVFAPSQP